MGDSQQQDTKKRAIYEPWTKEQSDVLLEILVESAKRGWRDNSGIFSKATVEERILPVLNQRLQCNKTYNHYLSRIKWFKTRWTAYSTLMKFNSGFGYDNNAKKFTAPDEVWDAYYQAHPKDAYLRHGNCPDYEDLEIAVGNGVAVGKNSIGLGSATNARTLGADENRVPHIEELNYDAETEAFVGLTQDDPPSSSSKSPLVFPEVMNYEDKIEDEIKDEMEDELDDEIDTEMELEFCDQVRLLMEATKAIIILLGNIMAMPPTIDNSLMR
ncbi:uncharacterized protein At2g29880-like [Salvia miltiorrhiza]|uniref:uncharacterized protein At2g29880-like n=1 Tax=Salvia miltiorrhiza TaxID=226208 RepID=UPI0025AD80A3|nr:uncharacterized protein At2g29880-like [Salvia miltiorrhiza]